MGLVLPQALFVIAAIVIGPILAADIGDDIGVGVIGLAAAPALVRGERLADALGGSRDAAAALFTGTLLLSLVIVEPALRRVVPAAGPGVGGAALAVGAGAALAATVPLVRDRLLVPLRWAEVLLAAALAGATALAAIVAGGLTLAASLAAAAVLLLGATAALLASWIGGARAGSVLAGAGTRDPAIAGAFCLSAAVPAAAGVPLAYGLLLVAASALAVGLRRRRDARDRGT